MVPTLFYLLTPNGGDREDCKIFFMKKYIFIIVILMFSCTEQDILIPFSNIPHTQYFDLQGTVSEMQIKAYTCDITASGYGEPQLANLKACLYPDCNPCFSLLFQDLILSYKDDIDIYFHPIKEINGMLGSVYNITDLSYSFNRNGFITDLSTYYRKDKIANIQIGYNTNDVVKNINYNLPSTTFSKDGGYQYDEGYKVYKNYTYRTDTIRLKTMNVSSDKDTSIYESKYKYINKGDFVEGFYFNEHKTDSFYIFYNSYKDANKVICYIDSFSYQRGNKLEHIDRFEQTIYIDNNKVSSILPDRRYLKGVYYVENSQSREIKYNDFIFYCNKTNNRFSEIINSHIPITYDVSYINDKRGNWIKMIITPSRKLYDRLFHLGNELVELEKDYQSWSPNKGENEIASINELTRIFERYNSIKKELNDNYSSYIIDNIGRISNKVIIERNILYFD